MMQMQKQKIRRLMFETNSSSTHSLSISKLMCYCDSIKPDKNNIVTIPRGEFGWGVERYNDALTKASYIVTDNPSREDVVKEIIKQVTLCDDVEIVGEGYVDHQSCGTSSEVSDEDLKDFIFSRNSWLFISNDNGGADNKLEFYNPPVYNSDGSTQPYFKYEFKVHVDNNTTFAAYAHVLKEPDEYYGSEEEDPVHETVKVLFNKMTVLRKDGAYNRIERVDDEFIYLRHESFDDILNDLVKELYDKDGEKTRWELKDELHELNVGKYLIKIPYTFTTLEQPINYDLALIGMRKLSTNGNCLVDFNVTNGTRIITYTGDKMQPDYPLNVDIRVSSKCSFGASNTRPAKCSFCHESARVDGQDCDYEKLYELITTQLPTTTEIAIGCNELTDMFKNFVHNLQVCGYQVSITVNQGHLDQMVFDLIYTTSVPLGVSYRKFANVKENTLTCILSMPNTVLHVIAGIDDVDDVLEMRSKGARKLLILGEKDFGFNRGNVNLDSDNHKEWRRRLLEVVNSFDVVSFDNLALEQLQVKRIMSDKDYEMFNNEEHSMYINAVDESFSPSSRSNAKTKWDEVSIKDYFQTQKLSK